MHLDDNNLSGGKGDAGIEDADPAEVELRPICKGPPGGCEGSFSFSEPGPEVIAGKGEG